MCVTGSNKLADEISRLTLKHKTIEASSGKSRKLQRIYPVLTVIQGREIGRDYRLRNSEYVIGRGTDCDIIILDEAVSRKHIKIQLTQAKKDRDDQCHLVGLGSSNKTHVNNIEVQDVVLKNGDKILVGNTILKFEFFDEVDIKYHRDIQKKIKDDALTQLLTKDSLCLALHHELHRCQQYHLPLSILIMDLDHMKKINDTFGYEAGNVVIREVGVLIKKNLRKTDVSARYGGEEFLAYLSEQTKEKAHIAADYMRMVIENAPIVVGSANIPVTISIGITQFPEDGKTIDELVAKADAALYQAKRRGRNLVCFA
jgi:diguanylate cyclase (GGDEF)-like protein